MNCPQCRQVLRDGARFCDGCGLAVAAFDAPTVKGEAQISAETIRDHDPLVGQVLDGKYELVARLGEGGMGAVYRGQRVHIGDEVAVKVLLQKFVADDASVERFRREARAAGVRRTSATSISVSVLWRLRGRERAHFILCPLASA